MNWSNVKLIFLREVRDQLRDRRTLFMIAVLPVLLYPFLGMSFVQVSQFLKEHPTRIWVIGAEALPERPRLIAGDRFASEFCPEEESRLLLLRLVECPAPGGGESKAAEAARRWIQANRCDAVVYFPPGFSEALARREAAAGRSPRPREPAAPPADLAPQPTVFYTRASDRSQVAFQRVDRVLRRWRDAIVEENLRRNRIPASATRPFRLDTADVSREASRRAAVWSKILPFVLLIWALTGAFYPAVDLCAGEKERGTLETLLSSPAHRSDIVWGKLLTVIVFSMATSLLNLLSICLTGALIIKQLGAAAQQTPFGPPPLAAVAWLLLALPPISAIFSALALAIAAFARSSKEGQYYLMPLLLISLPLMILPLMPSTELDLGTSLIPVTGIMLLLRSLIEGRFAEALLFGGPVILVTAACCLLAVRWAVDQFSKESVLFRENERWDLGIWLRHVARDRGETPTFGQALLCGVLLLLISFFVGLRIAPAVSWSGIAMTVVVTQVALIGIPVLLMAVVLTRNPRKTLSLRMPRLTALPAAVLLAVLSNPAVMLLGKGVELLYPLSEETLQRLTPYLTAMRQAPLPYVLLLIAALPAVCEELAFRGFILSGLRRSGRKWTAILLSSVFFGVAHGLLQQSLAACAVGVVIAYLVVQSGSLLPAVLFHFTHNALSVATSRMGPETLAEHPLLSWLFEPAPHPGQPALYHWPFVLLSAAGSIVILAWLHRLPAAEAEKGVRTLFRGKES